MSEEKRTETVSESNITRRSMLKWTAGLAVAGFIGVGVGYGASELLRPVAPPPGVVTTTKTETQTVATTVTGVPPVEEEQKHPMLVGDIVGGSPCWVYTKGGRIIRVTPMTYTEDEARPWSIQAGGKTFTPRKKSNLATYDQGYRRIVYSPTRVKYPLKRVGFAPGGNSSVENRGKGEFVRISWDEALDIMESELSRIKEKYGNAGILLHDSGHAQQAWIHQRSKIRRLLNIFGGQTTMIRNPDSNEGWHWGGWNVCGMMGPPSGALGNSADILESTMQNSKLLIHWATDGLTTFEGTSTDHADWWNWIKELGFKNVCISSDCNEFTAKYADKWIAPLPGTDAALMAAIANVWIKEETYDKEYVKTHAVGFDKWKDYVTGANDGIPKTPEWAAKITGVKARVIRALAREWASVPTSMACYLMACRGPYSTEHTRMSILLLTMQGLGKPGVSYFPITSAPSNPEAPGGGPWAPNGGMPFTAEPPNAVMQSLYYTVFPDGILNPPVKWYGGINAEKVELGKQSTQPPEEFTIWPEFAGGWNFYLGIFTHPTQMFAPTTYPKEGYPEVKMYWASTASFITLWNNTYKWMDAFRSPKLEFLAVQVPWFENDCYFADLVLPVTTTVEQDDLILAHGNSYGNDVAVRMEKCIEPIGESKTDLEICTEVARRLGIEEEYTEGRTLDDMLRFVYERDMPPELTNAMSFDEFSKKGYQVFKFPEMSSYKRNVGLRWYADQPEGAELPTPSGKIEFESQNLKKFFPNDKERPTVPHYVAEGPTHQESLTSARGKKYPLLMVTSHSRFKWHSRYTSDSWTWETTPTWHVKAKNGNWYWSLWINPVDAKARGIEEGDVVDIFNDRGEILAGAHVTERARPGMVHCTFGAPYRPSQPPGKPFMDTMGVASLISPYNTTSANAFGQSNGWFLVDVKKWVE